MKMTFYSGWDSKSKAVIYEGDIKLDVLSLVSNQAVASFAAYPSLPLGIIVLLEARSLESQDSMCFQENPLHMQFR